MGQELLVAVLGLVVGSVLLLGSRAAARDGRVLSGRAEGVVVELVRGSSRSTTNPGPSSWFPVVRWLDPTGQEQLVRGSGGANPPRHRVGQPLTVAYDPAGARPAQLVDSLQGTTLVLRWAGTLTLALGCAAMLLALAHV